MAFEVSVYEQMRAKQWRCTRCGERVLDHDADYQAPSAELEAGKWDANAVWLRNHCGPRPGTRVFIERDRAGMVSAEWINAEGYVSVVHGIEPGDYRMDAPSAATVRMVE